MKIDYSSYYMGTEKIYNSDVNGKTAYQNGVEVVRKPDPSLQLPTEVAKYDFSSKEEKKSFETKEEFTAMMAELQTSHGDGVMVSISGVTLNFLKIEKGKTMNISEGLAIETKPLTEENRLALYKQEKLYGDDGSNILNHSFINKGYQHGEDFVRAASGYAKYLNNNIETIYDDEIFYNCQDEELYKQEVKSKMTGLAEKVLSYFMMGKETEEDKMKLTGQLADAAIEYAKNMANGDNSISHVQTRLNIGGVEVTYGELEKMQSMLSLINEAGITMVHNNGQFEPYEYMGLATNYDTVAFAQLGLRTAQVNYWCDNELSEGAGNLLKKVWNERLDNTIKDKLLNPMVDLAKKTNEMLKESVKKYGNYSNAFVAQWGSGNGYTGSNIEKVYNMFAGISGSSKEEFQSSFSQVMNEYNAIRSSIGSNGYVGTTAEQKQLDYLTSTSDVIFTENY